VKRILAATETVAAVFLLFIALVTAGNVMLRDFFSIQIPDWFDGSKLVMCIALFWGMAVATYHAGHICVDVVWEHLSPANRRRMDLLASAVTVAFLAPLAWMVWAKVLTTGTQTTMDLRLPLVWFYAVAACGALAAAVLGLRRLWDLWYGHDPAADVSDLTAESEAAHGP
jgi:TRAP-type C4-dicarboxylate transport system permease small subunit